MNHGPTQVFEIAGLDVVVRKSLGSRIESIQYPIASNPQHPRAIFEQRINEGSCQTICPTCLVHVELKFIPVVAIKSVLGSEPHETEIVLHNLCDASLRKAF